MRYRYVGLSFSFRVSNIDHVAFDACFATARAKGLQLDLPAADTTLIKSGNLAHARHEFQFAEKAQDEEERMDVLVEGAGEGVDADADAEGEPEVPDSPPKRVRQKSARAKKSAETVESEPEVPRVAVSTF
jgi:hypothetical protein